MFRRWVESSRDPDLMLLYWLTVQLSVGWLLVGAHEENRYLWPVLGIASISFLWRALWPSGWALTEPYRRYAYLAGFMIMTMFTWRLTHLELLTMLHIVSSIVFSTLYLEPIVIWIVTLLYLPFIGMLYFRLSDANDRIVLLLLLLIVISLHTVCRVTRDKIAVIRKLEREQSFERLGQQQHLATIGQIAASIAHDIRNPLTSISGFVQLIEKSERRENYLEYYQIIRSEISRIDSLLREVLLLSKSHTIDTDAWQKVQLGTLLRRLATLLEPDAIKSNIEIHLHLDGDPVVEASEEKLHQVFLNILRNAFEAVQEKGRIDMFVGVEEGEAVVRIFDSGPGIPADKLDYLFTPFFTTKAEGTGLGLSICQSIIKAYGGAIHAGNGKERGAVFTITLPI